MSNVREVPGAAIAAIDELGSEELEAVAGGFYIYFGSGAGKLGVAANAAQGGGFSAVAEAVAWYLS